METVANRKYKIETYKDGNSKTGQIKEIKAINCSSLFSVADVARTFNKGSKVSAVGIGRYPIKLEE